MIKNLKLFNYIEYNLFLIPIILNFDSICLVMITHTENYKISKAYYN